MKLRTKIPLIPAKQQIDYNSQLLVLGSCFAENIGSKLDYYKFQSLQNPFGILFHPLAIENLIARAIHQKNYTEDDIFFVNERWHCFDAHSNLSNTSEEKLLQKLNSGIVQTQHQISKASHILITLGTAWIYRNKESGEVVANCHKVPINEFSKELLTTDEIQKSLSSLINLVKSLNQNAQFIFTISPVRHLKDGFVENQRSKANLILALHNTINIPPLGVRGLYFPAYELLMDELRDYRFYEADMVHPNQVAVDYIWEKFVSVWWSEATLSVMARVGDIQRGLAHRPFHPESEQHRKFQKSLEKKITYLQQEHGFMKFDS